MDNFNVRQALFKKHPELGKLIFTHPKNDTEESYLEALNEGIQAIKAFQTIWMNTEFQTLMEDVLLTKYSYKEYIEGAWKSEPLEKQVQILKRIRQHIGRHRLNPYYDECINQLETKQLVLLKQRLAHPIPVPLIGEVYTIAIHSRPFRSLDTYDINELYIPYYGLNLNTEHGFNVFLEGSYERHANPPTKTIEISPEMADRIYAAAKELAERDVLEKYVVEILGAT